MVRSARIIAGWILVTSCGRFCPGQELYDEGVLRTFKLTFSQANYWTLLTNNYASKTNLPATLTVDGSVYPGVGVRFRGNTSYQMTGSSQKKSFNIDVDHTVAGQDLMGYDSLNLLNCSSDATFMREVFYTNTCRQHVPSAKANFVRLEINGQNWGIYANVQQLNSQFIRDWFPSNAGTRWRGDGMGTMGGGTTPGGGGTTPGGGGTPPVTRGVEALTAVGVNEMAGGGVTAGKAALTWLGTASSSYSAVYELKHSDQADPWVSLINTCNVLNNTSPSQLPNVIDSVLNVDDALWLCAFEILFDDDDGYVNKRGSDYCLYYEPETGQIHLIQYDGNESMNTTTWSLFYRADDAAAPVMYRLVGNVPQYRQRFLAHVRTILDLYLTEDYFARKLDAYQALIDQEVKNDPKKMTTYAAFTSGVTTLKAFAKGRRSYLLTQTPVVTRGAFVAALTVQQELQQSIDSAPEILAVAAEAQTSDDGQTLTVTATVSTKAALSGVQVYVAAGPFAPFVPVAMTDVNLPDVAGDTRLFAAMLPTHPPGAVLRYYLQATAANAAKTVTFSPPGAEHQVYTHVVRCPTAASSAIVFNEVMAANSTCLADPQGQYDDWIELANTSDQPVDLSGMFLSDSPDNPLKWGFPQGSVIEAGGYLLVWADEDGGDSPGLHANFKLSSSKGETLWLYDTAAHKHALLDSVSLGSLEADQAFGRCPDGRGPMQVLVTPTPLAANTDPR